MTTEFIKEGKYIYHNNNFNKDSILKRSTIVSGQSGTGKSYVLNSMLNAIAPDVGRMYGFSATADADETFPFDEYTFPQMIHKDLNMTLIKKIHSYLEEKCGTIRKIKKKENISRYAKITMAIVMKYESKFGKEDRKTYDFLKKEAKKTGVLIKKISARLDQIRTKTERDSFIKKLVDIYVRIVIKGCELIISVAKKIPNKILNGVYNHLVFNPYTVIAINDLSNDVKALKGDDLKYFCDLFDRGRHVGLVIILLVHDWAQVKKEIRNAAHNFIFTSLEMVNNFVSIQQYKGDIAKDLNRAANIVIGRDRQLPEEKKRYTALFWMRLTNTYEYLIADPEGKQIGVGVKYWHDVAIKKRAKEKKMKDLF